MPINKSLSPELVRAKATDSEIAPVSASGTEFRMLSALSWIPRNQNQPLVPGRVLGLSRGDVARASSGADCAYECSL